MAQALCDSVATLEEQTQKLERLRKRLLDGLQDVEGMWLNGHLESRIPGIVNLGFEDVSGETLMLLPPEQPAIPILWNQVMSSQRWGLPKSGQGAASVFLFRQTIQRKISTRYVVY